VVVLSEAKRKETTVLSRVVYKNKQRFREWPPYGCSIPCRSRPRCTCRMRGHEAASWTLPSTSRPGGRLLKSRSASNKNSYKSCRKRQLKGANVFCFLSSLPPSSLPLQPLRQSLAPTWLSSLYSYCN
jgi:hypothetical protein